MASSSNRVRLRRLGFCGADDSTSPELLATISDKYPHVEWGVLFRPDKAGTPRYASDEWVALLVETKRRVGPKKMHLAAHLCGERCNQVLDGDATFVKKLRDAGFGRVQVNATAINGVDTSDLPSAAHRLRGCIEEVPQVEWIIQSNEETAPLVSVLTADPARNMSILFDASCGTGVRAESFPEPHVGIKCGYAGGMGPDNIDDVLDSLVDACGARPVWVDMESSLRAQQDGSDVFSISKAFDCIEAAADRFQHVDASGRLIKADPCEGPQMDIRSKVLFRLVALLIFFAVTFPGSPLYLMPTRGAAPLSAFKNPVSAAVSFVTALLFFFVLP